MTEKIANFQTVIKKYSLTVSVPMSEQVIATESIGIHEAEKLFAHLRNSTLDSTKKVEFERARLILKYSICHDAELEKIAFNNFEEAVEMTLNFRSVEDMLTVKAIAIQGMTGVNVL